MSRNDGLRELVEVLVGLFGVKAVEKEATRQYRLEQVERFVRMSSGSSSIRIARVKAVHVMGFTDGLREAKEWVEINCPDSGRAPLEQYPIPR